MLAIRSTLALTVLALLAMAMFAGQSFAQTYTYAPLPEGVTAADLDGQVLRPNVKTTTTNPQPVISGRVSGAASVVVRVGNTTVTATPGAQGQFTVTVTPALAPGEYQVSFNGLVVGTIVISAATPSAPRTGSGAPDGASSGFDFPVLPVVTGIAGAAVVAFYAMRQRKTLS